MREVVGVLSLLDLGRFLRGNLGCNIFDLVGWNRIKVSKNIGAIAVVPVAPVVTSLKLNGLTSSSNLELSHTLGKKLLKSDVFL